MRKLYTVLMACLLLTLGCTSELPTELGGVNKAMAQTNVRVLFSHQSVGRAVVKLGNADAEAARDAAVSIRSRLTDDATVHVEFWDQDYDDKVDPLCDGTGTDAGYTFGGGTFRGYSGDVYLEHLMVESLRPHATGDAATWRDSVATFDIVIIKPGYRQLDNDSDQDYSALKDSLLAVADWWDNNCSGWLVIATCSAVQYPAGGVTSTNWSTDAGGQAEAIADVAQFREFCIWLKNTWVCRNNKLRFFDTFYMTADTSSADPTVKWFCQSGLTNGTSDDHLDNDGSDLVQDELVAFINQLAAEFVGSNPIYKRRYIRPEQQ